MLHNLRHNFIVDRFAVGIILRTGFRGNGKALRNGHSKIRHFRKVGAFSAQQLSHAAVTFLEVVNVLLTHFV